MKASVLIPALLVISGMVGFAILPLPLWVRGVVLASDLAAAAVIWLALSRQGK
jgi:hypothetical protein